MAGREGSRPYEELIKRSQFQEGRLRTTDTEAPGETQILSSGDCDILWLAAASLVSAYLAILPSVLVLLFFVPCKDAWGWIG